MAEIIPTVLVDSVIMIDHFNGISAATQYLLEMQGQLAISVITRAEVLTGFEGKERQLARRLLSISDTDHRPRNSGCRSYFAAAESLEDA